MIAEEPLLQARLSEFLRWERTKRREKTLAAALFYSLLASLAALPAQGLLPPWASPFAPPALFFLILAPALFLLRPWGGRESLRALFLLDRTLRLEERALTAWEILGRKERKGFELLVLEEAGERLRGISPRSLFKRNLGWHGLCAPPLLLLWIVLVWLDVGVHWNGMQGARSASLGRKLREFSYDVREKAEAQGLVESLKAAHALKEVAEKNVRGEIGERELREELARMMGKIREARPAGAGGPDASFSTDSREGLSALRAELESLKDLLNAPGLAMREDKPEAEILGRLGASPRVREELQKGAPAVEKLSGKELDRLLDKLEKGAAAELDRRTLQEIQEFLASLAGESEGQETEIAVRDSSEAEKGRPAPAERARGTGTLPGDQPGAEGQSRPMPPFQASAATHLKGLLGEGQRSSTIVGAQGSREKGQIANEEILTSYKRQAEEELASERIPQGLEETIRRYFLSLGMAEK